MSQDNPLATWQANFKRDVQMLSQLMLLRTHRSDEPILKEMRPLFQSAADSLSELEAAKSLLEKYVSAQTAQLSRLHEFHARLAAQKRRVGAIRAHIPAELCDSLALNADDRTPPISRLGSADTTASDGKENSTVNFADAQEKPVKHTKKVMKKKATAKPASAKSRSQKKAVAPVYDEDAPEISHVEQAELDAAPQYVRGRLTVDKISVVVAKLNEIVQKKYTLLAQPFLKLSSADITTRQEMQEAECPETEGRHFLTDAEIRTFGGYRMDATVKAVINMLRHTGALKEVRGKNRTRILIIQ